MSELIPEAELIALANEVLPTYPQAEIVSELARYTPDAAIGNAVFVRRILYMVLYQVGKEEGDLTRLRQLINIAIQDYRDLYLLVTNELHYSHI